MSGDGRIRVMTGELEDLAAQLRRGSRGVEDLLGAMRRSRLALQDRGLWREPGWGELEALFGRVGRLGAGVADDLAASSRAVRAYAETVCLIRVEWVVVTPTVTITIPDVLPLFRGKGSRKRKTASKSVHPDTSRPGWLRAMEGRRVDDKPGAHTLGGHSSRVDRRSLFNRVFHRKAKQATKFTIPDREVESCLANALHAKPGRDRGLARQGPEPGVAHGVHLFPGWGKPRDWLPPGRSAGGEDPPRPDPSEIRPQTR